MAPIHEHEVDRAVDGMFGRKREHDAQETGELCRVTFHRSLARIPVLDSAAALNFLIGKLYGGSVNDHRCECAAHEARTSVADWASPHRSR